MGGGSSGRLALQDPEGEGYCSEREVFPLRSSQRKQPASGMGQGTPKQYPRQTYTRLVVSPRSLVPYRRPSTFLAGYTIVDSLILFNGTLYIVTDRHAQWPSLDQISAVTPSADEQYKNDLQFISPEEAVTLIPPLAGR